MYDPADVLSRMHANNELIIVCLLGNLVFAFAYFGIGVYLTRKNRVYALPFTAAALFFWHDLTYVFDFNIWFHQYPHWWFQFTWFALIGTVLFEAFLIQQFIKYGRAEIFPEMSTAQFTAMTIGGLLGVGAIWFLVKGSLHDDLFLIGFALTAIWSVPFHTSMMLKRRSSASQSVAMQLSVIVIFAAVSLFFVTVAPDVFRTPLYFGFYVTFNVWCAVNIYLIRKLPASPAYPALAPISWGPPFREEPRPVSA